MNSCLQLPLAPSFLILIPSFQKDNLIYVPLYSLNLVLNLALRHLFLAYNPVFFHLLFTRKAPLFNGLPLHPISGRFNSI
jgi:hypothetical protein